MADNRAKNKYAQAQRMAKAKKLDQERIDKNIAKLSNAIDIISSWDKNNLSQEVKYLAAVKKRLIEFNMLPATLDTIYKIQNELTHFQRDELWVAGSYKKLDFREWKPINTALKYKELNYAYANMLVGMANWKAMKAVPLALAQYPENAVGLLQFMQDFKAEVKSLIYPVNHSFGSAVLNAKYVETVKVKADEYYISGIREKISELTDLQSKDYSALKMLKEINSDVETLQTLINFDKQWYAKDKRRIYNEYKEKYETTRVAMIQKSLPVLIDWVNSLPPSMKTVKLLDKFTEEAFGTIRGAGDVRFRKLFHAIGEAHTRCNPEQYARPDIILSLQRGYWGEVKSEALEDIAYFSTAFNKINERCPGIATDGQKRLFDSHVGSKTRSAMERNSRGNPLTKKDAEMYGILFANALINRPGCKTDDYGNITSCITVEESQNMTKELMTSSSGLSDTHAFLSRNSCSSEPVKQYVKNLAEYSGRSSLGGGFPSVPKFPY